MSAHPRPLILLSNDDGIHSPGLHLCGQQLAQIGDIYVVAPHMEQSAASHALTIRTPLHAERLESTPYSQNVFAVNGSPADCVLLGLNKLIPRAPDMIVSGINRGVNLGPDILYSGTVAAAMEGAMNGFPAVAISAQLSPTREICFDAAAQVAYKIVSAYLGRQQLRGSVLNVNVPHLPYSQLKGVKAAATGERLSWRNMYHEYEDPLGRQTYWIGTNGENYRQDPSSDCALLPLGWVTLSVLTPSFFAPQLHQNLTSELPFL